MKEYINKGIWTWLYKTKIHLSNVKIQTNKCDRNWISIRQIASRLFSITVKFENALMHAGVTGSRKNARTARAGEATVIFSLEKRSCWAIMTAFACSKSEWKPGIY
jgi:hypothetical protein